MRVTVHLSNELEHALKAAAREEGRSVSSFVGAAVEDCLKRKRRKLAGEALLNLAGRTRVAEDAMETLRTGRTDDERS